MGIEALGQCHGFRRCSRAQQVEARRSHGFLNAARALRQVHYIRHGLALQLPIQPCPSLLVNFTLLALPHLQFGARPQPFRRQFAGTPAHPVGHVVGRDDQVRSCPRPSARAALRGCAGCPVSQWSTATQSRRVSRSTAMRAISVRVVAQVFQLPGILHRHDEAELMAVPFGPAPRTPAGRGVRVCPVSRVPSAHHGSCRRVRCSAGGWKPIGRPLS